MEVNDQNIGTLRQLMGTLMSYDNKARKEGEKNPNWRCVGYAYYNIIDICTDILFVNSL